MSNTKKPKEQWGYRQDGQGVRLLQEGMKTKVIQGGETCVEVPFKKGQTVNVVSQLLPADFVPQGGGLAPANGTCPPVGAAKPAPASCVGNGGGDD